MLKERISPVYLSGDHGGEFKIKSIMFVF